jgi:hypothetical protein
VNDPTRTTLRQAIATRASARAAHQAATDALARSDELLADLAAEAERHKQTIATADSKNADALAAEIERGGAAVVALSPADQSARQALADVTGRTDRARLARGRLSSKLADAKAALAAAERAVLSAAAAVIGQEAVAHVEQFHAALKQLHDATDALAALNSLGVHLPPRTPLPAFPAPVQTALYDLASLELPLGQLRPATLLQNGPRAVAVEKLAAYFTALAANADATFADIAEPTLPRVTPHAPAAPIIRVQDWAPTAPGLSAALAGPHVTV